MAKRLIIIPCFNEAKNIENIICKTRSVVKNADILVIDDGSGDDTNLIALNKGTIVLRHPFNLGYGVALQTGFKYAKEHNYDYVYQMDGDGQHDPVFFKKLINTLEEKKWDIVIGSRFLGKAEYKIPLPRLVGIKILSFILSFLAKQKITDPTSGFRGMNKRAYFLCAEDIFPTDFPDADFILTLIRLGFSVKEVPVIMYKSKNKKSMHSGFAPLYYIFKMVISIFITMLRKERQWIKA